MLPLFAALATGGAVVAVLLLLTRPRASALDTRLIAVRNEFEQPGRERAAAGIFAARPGALGKAIVSALPSDLRGRLDVALLHAGHPITAQRFVMFMVVASSVLALTGFAIARNAAPGSALWILAA